MLTGALRSWQCPARAADDAFAWAPAHAPAVARGRQSGARFGLVGLTEVEVEVDDLYDAANRQALRLAEQRIAAVPGVRAVFGPAGLLDVTVDGSGKPSARPVLARGKTEIRGRSRAHTHPERADPLGGPWPGGVRRGRVRGPSQDPRPRRRGRPPGSGSSGAPTRSAGS